MLVGWGAHQKKIPEREKGFEPSTSTLARQIYPFLAVTTRYETAKNTPNEYPDDPARFQVFRQRGQRIGQREKSLTCGREGQVQAPEGGTVIETGTMPPARVGTATGARGGVTWISFEDDP
jgi:hypothetical protein